MRYRPDHNDMSDLEAGPAVQEVFESGHVCVEDLLGNLHGRCTRMVTREVMGDVHLSASRIFGSGPIIGGDDLNIALETGKG